MWGRGFRVQGLRFADLAMGVGPNLLSGALGSIAEGRGAAPRAWGGLQGLMNRKTIAEIMIAARQEASRDEREREFSIDNLLVRIHSIVEMNLVDRPCAMEVSIPIFQVVLCVGP